MTFGCTDGGTLLWMASKFADLGGRDPLRTLTSRMMMDVRAAIRTWFFAATVADSKSWRLEDARPDVGVCGFLSFLGLDFLKRMVAWATAWSASLVRCVGREDEPNVGADAVMGACSAETEGWMSRPAYGLTAGGTTVGNRRVCTKERGAHFIELDWERRQGGQRRGRGSKVTEHVYAGGHYVHTEGSFAIDFESGSGVRTVVCRNVDFIGAPLHTEPRVVYIFPGGGLVEYCQTRACSC